MNYLGFREKLLPLGVFSTNDARKYFPGMDSRRLVEWQQKGYIKKLINRWYLFSEISLNEDVLMRISNCLMRPSYVSLEFALSYYGLIPEGVYTIQGVTTAKTHSYNTPAGSFSYRKLKQRLFFGYHIRRPNGFPILIAEPEKALLDFFYFNFHIRDEADLLTLRLNSEVLQTLDREKLARYADYFNSKVLNNRIKFMNETFYNDYIK